MFQIDDNFLQSVGLGQLPDDQKAEFLRYFRQQLELRVGTELSNGLTDQQLLEFEYFVDRDMPRVKAWLDQNDPDYESSQVFQKVKARSKDVPDDVVLSEYASIRWLGKNSPNYRDVVIKVMNELKQEILDNKDAILASD